ncbi:hypothetical protein EsDP_00006088 [Epichloe bromicola]|uniref:Uncharacterized protein n=1 Tax=Epichloe bromicola TaxID=79588 RepID=A0ABQ0CWK5_9HYPO
MLLIVLLALLGAALGVPSRDGHKGISKKKLCADRCNDIFFECKADPASDKMICGADYVGCLGYNPLGLDGQLSAIPTACYSAKGAPHPRPTMDSCAQKCHEKFELCRDVAWANPLACASDYASCLGYSPFPSKTNEKLVPPTVCSKSPPGPTIMKPRDTCVDDCLAEYNECKNEAGSTQPTWCAGKLAICLGYSPFDDITGSFEFPPDCVGIEPGEEEPGEEEPGEEEPGEEATPD